LQINHTYKNFATTFQYTIPETVLFYSHYHNSTNMTTTHMPKSISTASAKLDIKSRLLFNVPPRLGNYRMGS
jgi:hypothetical protein